MMRETSAGRGSLFSFVMHNKGPDRIKKDAAV